jgi:hypothetical protein
MWWTQRRVLSKRMQGREGARKPLLEANSLLKRGIGSNIVNSAGQASRGNREFTAHP